MHARSKQDGKGLGEGVVVGWPLGILVVVHNMHKLGNAVLALEFGGGLCKILQDENCLPAATVSGSVMSGFSLCNLF